MSLAPSKSNKPIANERLDKLSLEAANDNFLRQFIQTLPYVTAILDRNRRVVLSNNIQLERKYEFSIEEFFGQHIGKALNCLHYRKPYASCDGKGICKYCGLPNVIIRAEKLNSRHSQETTITIQFPGNTEKTYDVLVTAAPFKYQDEQFLIITIIDISEQKRKRALERIFFHDVLNKTGSLEGIFELLSDGNHKENNEELIKLSGEVIKDLNEELLLQKSVMAAESGDLKVKGKEIRTTEVIEESIKQVIQYPESKNIQIIHAQDSIEEILITDPTILKRILINMLKNAVEASKTDQNVHIGCYNNAENIAFWVHNYAYIPESSQIQIFERTFSTKGEDRGLGTYSIKLLGEKYLGGKAYFTSNIKEGTTFYFELPKNKK